jgi:hypothetical protein
MTDELLESLRALIDHREIEAALLRYCRGVDRLDKSLMLSAYHPDAIDDHGVVVLQAEAFCDWAIGYHGDYNGVTHHAISNLTIELDGDTAHSECYYTYMGTFAGGRTQLAFGRYVDRHERREGRWAIASRCCFTEAVHDIDPADLPADFATKLMGNGPQSRDRGDASYMRPLRHDPARIAAG